MKAVEIYSKMHTLRTEVKEFQKALEILSDEIGTHAEPYKLMKKLYDEKSKEAIQFENKQFEEVK
jgi:hypothetical protein